jgi:hypothetical protein
MGNREVVPPKDWAPTQGDAEMENIRFTTWHSMLHTLPGLQRLSDSVVEDAQNDESRETLVRRLGVLADNVASMSDAALQLTHTPAPVAPIVDGLQVLNTHIAEAHQNAPYKDYEHLIQTVCDVHTNVMAFVQCVWEVSRFLEDQTKPPHSLAVSVL